MVLVDSRNRVIDSFFVFVFVFYLFQIIIRVTPVLPDKVPIYSRFNKLYIEGQIMIFNYNIIV